MSHIELDSFLFKFKCLWQAGYKASLKVETIAGEAKVVLEAGLGHFPVPPPPFNFPQGNLHPGRHHNGPAQKRRRERREAARRAASAQEQQNVDATDKTEAETALVTEIEIAEEAVSEENNALIVSVPATEKVNEPAAIAEQVEVAAFQCELCDKNFESERGLNTHHGRMHKQKTILQVDGTSDTFESTYSFVSDFAREDIDYTIEEVITEAIDVKVISREKIGDPRKSAEYLYTISVGTPSDDWQWPKMSGLQSDVLKMLKKGSSICC